MKKVFFVLAGIVVAVVSVLLGDSDWEKKYPFVTLFIRIVATIALIICGLLLLVEHPFILVRMVGATLILTGLLIAVGFAIRIEQC